MSFGQGDNPFGVYDAKVATYNDTDDYGSLTDVMSVEMARHTMQLVSAMARGDDQITDAASVVEGAQLGLRFTGLNLSAMAVLTGISIGTISSVDQLQFAGGEHMPYFGVIVKANSNGTTDTWLYLPKCIIMENFQFFQSEYGSFSSPELTVQALPDTTYGVANLITHPTETDITVMPPANIAQVS